eukprot:31130-Pelagococcus_subviridis.AAC.3
MVARDAAHREERGEVRVYELLRAPHARELFRLFRRIRRAELIEARRPVHRAHLRGDRAVRAVLPSPHDGLDRARAVALELGVRQRRHVRRRRRRMESWWF